MHQSDCELQFASSTLILTKKNYIEKTEGKLLITVLFDTIIN